MIGQNREIDVNIQSQTGETLDYLFVEELKTDCALAQATAIDDTILNLAPGHGFTGASGEVLTIFYANRCEQFRVVSVATNAITVEAPVSIDYPVVGSVIVRGNYLMNVDGSTTQRVFKFKPRGATPIDISTSYLLAQSGSSVPDDGNFLGITAITKGLLWRCIDGSIYTKGNFRNNQDFKRRGAQVTYSTKAPSGTNATDIVFKHEEIAGQVIRLDPRTDDELWWIVRDNLSTIASLFASACTSYTSGE
jgi:hypothetical protein